MTVGSGSTLDFTSSGEVSDSSGAIVTVDGVTLNVRNSSEEIDQMVLNSGTLNLHTVINGSGDDLAWSGGQLHL